MPRSTTTTTTAAVTMLGALTLMLAACSSDSGSATTSASENCTPAHQFTTHSPGVLTVGVIASAPYTILDPVTNEWTGMDAEWAKAIAARECLTIDATAVPGSDAIQKVQDGTIDLLSAGAFITPERGEVVGQTDPLYYQYTAIVSKDGIAKVEDLQGQSVGVVAGSLYVDPLRQALGTDSVKEYPTTTEILADLANGRIAAAVMASGESAYQLQQNNNADLKAVQIEKTPAAGALADIYGTNMPFQKSNTAFGAALNENIAALRNDGTAKQILVNWNQDNETTLNGS